VEVLGAVIGAPDEMRKHFSDAAQAAIDLRTAIGELDEPAAELTLGRSCADIAKVSHLFRIAGDVIDGAQLEGFDSEMMDFVESVLGGDIGDEAKRQAALGIPAAGLGIRGASDVAAAAFLASCVESTPMVSHIFDGMAAAGLPVEAARSKHAEHGEKALAKALALLAPPGALKLQSLIAEASTRAAARFGAMRDGKELRPEGGGDMPAGGGANLVSEPGAEDPEHARSIAAPKLQKRIAALLDGDRAAAIVAKAAADGRTHDAKRISDLSDPTIAHDWLWSLAPTSRHTLDQDIYVDAVRLRLGAAASPALACRACGKKGPVGGAHALCCARGPSTKGHNEVRDRLLALAKLGDPDAESEAKGLLPAAPALRPADVLTSAAGGPGLIAMDVGIASPDAQLAIAEPRGDACEAMRCRKVRVYEPYARDMAALGLRYEPLPWSCWGREHPATTTMLISLCRRAARRKGLADWKCALHQFRADVSALLARRAAEMWRQCALGSACPAALLGGDAAACGGA